MEQLNSGARNAPERQRTIPRILVLPPTSDATGIDPLEMCIARALLHDISLTLCKSRLYEVIAPFTARRLADSSGDGPAEVVDSDFQVRTQVCPGLSRDLYPILFLEIVATASGGCIYRNEVELRSGLLLDLHYVLCATLTEQICGSIARQEILEFRRSGAATAYVHYLLAMQHAERKDLASLRRAQQSLTRAAQMAPDYVPALSQLARTKTLEWLERATPDRTLLAEARHLAQRAQFYEPADSASLREIGHASLYLHDLESALACFEAAQAFAPNHADLLADQADALSHASRHEEAEAKISRALALNPLAPDDYYWVGGAISFFRGRYEEALSRLTTMQCPGLALRLMAACAAMNDQPEAAARYREWALLRDPSFTVEKWTSLYPQPNRADTALYLHALRLAGFPSTSS